MALKSKFSKPKTEIPNQVRDDKTREPNPVAMLVSASDQGFLPLADTPFIPVHRTGFSGVTLIK
jgi:hypothetical protein